MKPSISVIVCTHNPRRDYLERVIGALKFQTLTIEQWELLLIDNASSQLLSLEIDLSWHSNARHIREEQLGLTSARLRGIQEAVAETLIFVDDDNVLNSDYLEMALKISQASPTIGAWGGQIIPDFEEQPPDWTKPYWPYLGIREFDQNKWSNLLHQYETTPCGAGLCVRRIVTDKYADLVRNDLQRAKLDRKGELLLSGGDSDLAFTACDIGLGTGQFVYLKLTHLISANRLHENYLIRLMEGMYYSNIILDSFRGRMTSLQKLPWHKRIVESYRLWRMSPRERRFYKAIKRGQALAINNISTTYKIDLQLQDKISCNSPLKRHSEAKGKTAY